MIKSMDDIGNRSENPCVGGSIPPSATKNNDLPRLPRNRIQYSGRDPISSSPWRSALWLVARAVGVIAAVLGGLFIALLAYDMDRSL